MLLQQRIRDECVRCVRRVRRMYQTCKEAGGCISRVRRICHTCQEDVSYVSGGEDVFYCVKKLCQAC